MHGRAHRQKLDIGHNHDTQVMAGRGKLPAFLKHLKATRFHGHHDDTVGRSGSGDSVADEGANDTERSRCAQRSFTHECTGVAALVGFVGVDKNRSAPESASWCVRLVMVFLIGGVISRVKNTDASPPSLSSASTPTSHST